MKTYLPKECIKHSLPNFRKFILVFLMALSAPIDVSAHASTITRKWCGGFFHRKFVARAQTSALIFTKYQSGYNCIGQYIGTANIGRYGVTCSDESKGCSRPQVATCSKSGVVYDRLYGASGCTFQYTAPHSYSAYAKAQHLVGGIYLTYSASGRGGAGFPGIFTDGTGNIAAADNGTSFSEITGEVDIDDANRLMVKNMNGKLSITSGTNYFSNIKMVIIKEKEGISDDEALQNEEAVQNGTYPDVVYTSRLDVSKNGISHSGIFSKGLASGTIKEFSANQENGVNFNGFSIVLPVQVSLQPDEKLTLVTVVDGALDPAAGPEDKNSGAEYSKNNGTIPGIQLYPNPAREYVDVHTHLTARETMTFSLVNPSGKEFIKESHTVESGRQSTRLNTRHLLPGVYLLEIRTQTKTDTQKLLISP